MVTRVQPGCRILNSEQPNFYRLPKCVHQHSVHYSKKLPPSPCLLLLSQSSVSVLLCSRIDLMMEVMVLVALRGRLEERRVRPRCGWGGRLHCTGPPAHGGHLQRQDLGQGGSSLLLLLLPQTSPCSSSMHATRSCTLLCAILACHHQWDKEAGKGLIGACTRMRCAVLAAGPRVQSAVERSARTVHASTRGGRLRAGPSFLAKVDLLIGRWPGWEGGTHLCSRCSSSHHIKPAAISQWWQLIAV